MDIFQNQLLLLGDIKIQRHMDPCQLAINTDPSTAESQPLWQYNYMGTPRPTIYKWLFQLDDSQSLHRKWLEITKHLFRNGCLGFQGIKPHQGTPLLSPNPLACLPRPGQKNWKWHDNLQVSQVKPSLLGAVNTGMSQEVSKRLGNGL